MLHALMIVSATETLSSPAPSMPPEDSSQPPLYIVVEKILGKDESLPEEWPVQGTTGYDFLNQVNGLFVAGANEQSFTDFYLKVLEHGQRPH